jgi:hypothetical protein
MLLGIPPNNPGGEWKTFSMPYTERDSVIAELEKLGVIYYTLSYTHDEKEDEAS